jgi:TRAP-type C4-dicarboxylate transport system permease small subunit
MVAETHAPPAGVTPAGGLVLRVIDGAILISSLATALVSTLALFVVISIDVIVRYVTHSSLGWANEMPNLLFPWMTMAGIVIAAQWGRHVAVELAVRQMPERIGRIVVALSQIPIAATFIYLAWTGIEIIEITAGELYPVMRVPTSWAYLSMPIAFVLLAVTALTTAVRVMTQGGDLFVVREGLNEGEGDHAS